jgi:hypothetical protein
LRQLRRDLPNHGRLHRQSRPSTLSPSRDTLLLDLAGVTVRKHEVHDVEAVEQSIVERSIGNEGQQGPGR